MHLRRRSNPERFHLGGQVSNRGRRRVVSNNTNVNASQTCASANVGFNAQYYPDTWYGNTFCAHALPANRACSYKTVYLNLRTSTTVQQRRKTSLHELGHVAGLAHRDASVTSVMASGASPPASEFLDDHDDVAINNTYP